MPTIVVHDFETTSLDLKTTQIVQSAVALVEVQEDGNWDFITKWTGLHNPGVPIPEEASEIHGIYDKDVEDCAHANSVLPLVYQSAYNPAGHPALRWVKENPAGLMGFNSNAFDNLIAGREGYLPAPLPEYDMAVAAIRLLSKGTISRGRLVDMYQDLLGREPTNAHDAMADVVMTLDCIKPAMSALGYDSASEFLHSLTVAQVDRHMVMPFGKHRGKKLVDVPRSYLKWLHKQDVIPDLKESALATLKVPLTATTS